tara:strand:- start:874 stop:1848 length:975 start_codon:yes stop_codon:yes gene_type:complete
MMAWIRVVAVAGCVVVCLAVPAVGQESLRTAWGTTDLQGVWDFRTITPLQRPEERADQEFLSEEETANLEQEVLDRNERLLNAEARRTEAGGSIGAYNNFWMDTGTTSTGRTSLIIDPPNGRFPDMTEAGQARAAGQPTSFKDVIYESYTELSNFDRCITGFNAGPPITPAGYNQNMQLFQTENYVAVLTEMVHTTRIIPIDSGAHIDGSIRQWSGDSRAHWDGDTLVVETENFNDHDLHFNWRGSSTNMKLVERFRRVDADTLSYEFTVTDPETWVTPWTAEVPMKRNELPLFEYACHEGNYSMEAMLAGARADEQKAAQGGQ